MAKVTGEQIVFGILSYLGILVLIPLLLKKDDKFVYFHAKQGLVWLIFTVILWVVTFILAFIPVLGVIINTLVWLGVLAVFVVLVIKVATGEMWELPILGEYAKKLKI